MSYLATGCLRLLAEIYRDKYPIGSVCVQKDFYVDDLLTGADTIAKARVARDEIINLLQEGAFGLSKWSSNGLELLDHVNQQHGKVVTINDGRNSSVLGTH